MNCEVCGDRGWVRSNSTKVPCVCNVGQAWSHTLEGQLYNLGYRLRQVGALFVLDATRDIVYLVRVWKKLREPDDEEN